MSSRAACISFAKKYPEHHAAYLQAKNEEPEQFLNTAEEAAAAKKFEALVEAQVSGGKSRRKAMQETAITHPELFDAWTMVKSK